MKKVILLFTLLSAFFVWNCSDELDLENEWNSSARSWEEKLGNYRGTIEVTVDGLPMDTIVQQVSFTGTNYDQVNLIIENLSILDERYGYIYFREMSFKDVNGVICIKGKQNASDGTPLGLVTYEILGEIKDDVLTFDLTINGTQVMEHNLHMTNGVLVKEFPSDLAFVESATFVEANKELRPFITGTPSIYNANFGTITFFVADSLTITDSTFFSVKPILKLAQGAWIKPDTTMNWRVTHNLAIEDAPSIATCDSLYSFTLSKLNPNWKMFYDIRVWAADSINYRDYRITYAKSNAIKIDLFHWEKRDGYLEPIAGWATNNAYIKELSKKYLNITNLYTDRVLGANIGDNGARMRSGILGTVKDSNIVVVSGKLFRGEFDMDSLLTPKQGELHGVPFSKRKPVSLRGQYKYIPGEVLYVGDSIVPDSVLDQTDSCYIEAFLYESLTPEVYLDSLNYKKDPKVIGTAKFVGGKSYGFRDFSMSFDVKNWVPNRRYHLGIVCKSSGKSEQRIGAAGSDLTVSGFELMSTEVSLEF